MKYYDYGACMNKDDTILQCVFSTHLTNLYCNTILGHLLLNEKFIQYVDHRIQLHVFLFTMGQKVNSIEIL